MCVCVCVHTGADIKCPPNPFIYFGVEKFTTEMSSHRVQHYRVNTIIYDLVPKGVQEKRTEVPENKVDRVGGGCGRAELGDSVGGRNGSTDLGDRVGGGSGMADIAE